MVGQVYRMALLMEWSIPLEGDKIHIEMIVQNFVFFDK